MSNYMVDNILDPKGCLFAEADEMSDGTTGDMNGPPGTVYVGPSTNRPFGFTYEELFELLVNVASWKLTPDVIGSYGGVSLRDDSGMRGNTYILDLTAGQLPIGDGIIPFLSPFWELSEEGDSTTLINNLNSGGMPPCRNSFGLSCTLALPSSLDYDPLYRLPIQHVPEQTDYFACLDHVSFQFGPKIYTFDGLFYPTFVASVFFQPEIEIVVPAEGEDTEGFPESQVAYNFYEKFSQASFRTAKAYVGMAFGGVDFSSLFVDDSQEDPKPDIIQIDFDLKLKNKTFTVKLSRYRNIYNDYDVQGKVTLEPHKYHTYGGIYDENTGERV